MASSVATISGVQFDALSYEEGRRWELLEGELIDVSSPTPEHQDIVFNLLSSLKRHLRGMSGGRAHQEVEFALSEHDRLRPDICVLLGKKADLDPRKTPIFGAPDIAVEVISATERAGDTRRKVLTYLRSGVGEVWQIYPLTREVLVNTGTERLEFHQDQILTTKLLPGWSVAVSALFD